MIDPAHGACENLLDIFQTLHPGKTLSHCRGTWRAGGVREARCESIVMTDHESGGSGFERARVAFAPSKKAVWPITCEVSLQKPSPKPRAVGYGIVRQYYLRPNFYVEFRARASNTKPTRFGPAGFEPPNPKGDLVPLCDFQPYFAL